MVLPSWMLSLFVYFKNLKHSPENAFRTLIEVLQSIVT